MLKNNFLFFCLYFLLGIILPEKISSSPSSNYQQRGECNLSSARFIDIKFNKTIYCINPNTKIITKSSTNIRKEFQEIFRMSLGKLGETQTKLVETYNLLSGIPSSRTELVEYVIEGYNHGAKLVKYRCYPSGFSGTCNSESTREVIGRANTSYVEEYEKIPKPAGYNMPCEMYMPPDYCRSFKK